MPSAEIITIGDELLSGETVDTNSNYLDGILEGWGYRVERHTTVVDDVVPIAEVFSAACRRVELVISSGGLGPTEDDLTLEALAKALGCGLRKDEATLEKIRERFRSFGREMTPNNERQAMVPEIGEVIENKSGTAPAFRAPLEGAEIWLLPGVPREVRFLVEHQLRPRLDRRAPLVMRRTLKVIGVGESRLEHNIRQVVKAHRTNVRFGYRALGAETHIKLAASGENKEEHVARAEAALREVLGGRIFGADDDQIAQVLVGALRSAHQTLAAAESCTGGLIGKLITDVPGASVCFRGAVVAYDNEIKSSMLGVSAETLAVHGAVSEACAREMAEGVRARLSANIGLAATGIAGPDGGTPKKPVGSVCVALASPRGIESRAFQLPGDRDMVREGTAKIALDLVLGHLRGHEPTT